MAARGIPIYLPSLVNASGVPVTGGKVYSWKPTSAGAASATARALYSDAELATPAANPYILGTSGDGVVYRDPDLQYTAVVKSANDATTYATIFYPAGGGGGLDASTDLFFNVDDYGADPTGTDDSTAAWQAACAAAQSASGGVIWATPGGTYKIYPDSSNTTALGTFSGTRGISLAFNGCKFTVARSFTSGQQITLFNFNGQSSPNYDIETGDCELVHTDATMTAAYSTDKGCSFIAFRSVNDRVRMGKVKMTGGVICVQFNCSSGDSKTTDHTIESIDCYRVGYPYSLISNGDHGRVGLIRNEECGRPLFCSGFRGLTINEVDTLNPGLETIIGTIGSGNALYVGTESATMDGLHIGKYKCRTPTGTPGSQIALIMRGAGAQIWRNIYIGLEVNLAGTNANEVVLRPYKWDNSDVADTGTRGHVIDGLKIDGWVRGFGSGQGLYPFILFDRANDVSTDLGDWSVETVRGLEFGVKCVGANQNHAILGDFTPMASSTVSFDGMEFGGGQRWKGNRPPDGKAKPNLLPNGDFAVAQRGAGPFTAASTFVNNDDAYLIDGCIFLADGADTCDVSQQTTTIPTDGRYALALDVETANRKFGVLFPLENADCIGSLTKRVCAGIRARKGGSNATLETLRMAIISWAGTADSITSDVVSAWGAAGTSPTLAANWTYETTATSITLTTAFTHHWITGLIDTASTKQFALFVWVDDTDATVADFLYLADATLQPGWTPTEYPPRNYQAQLARCQRLLRPIARAGSSHDGSKQSNALMVADFDYEEMRIAPSLVQSTIAWEGVTNPGSGEVAFYDLTGAAFVTITGALTVQLGGATVSSTILQFVAATSFSGTAGDTCQLQVGADVYLLASAEL